MNQTAIPGRKFSRPTRDGEKGSQRGVTLIESALVISIIALIILASMIALNALMEQRRLTQVVTDITSIRSAVTKWCAGGPVLVVSYETGGPTLDRDRTLTNFSQLAGFLPSPMERLAQKNQTLRLFSANPWDGHYIIVTPLFRTVNTSIGPALDENVEPRVWSLTVTDVPGDLLEPLANQLRNTGAYSVATIPSQMNLPAEESANPRNIAVVFKE